MFDLQLVIGQVVIGGQHELQVRIAGRDAERVDGAAPVVGDADERDAEAAGRRRLRGLERSFDVPSALLLFLRPRVLERDGAAHAVLVKDGLRGFHPKHGQVGRRQLAAVANVEDGNAAVAHQLGQIDG